MSGKEKLTISSKKELNWLKHEAENYSLMHERLRGKLLTTLEAALPSGKQLEALKSRVRDIQNQISDVIEQDSYSIYAHRFVASDEPKETKPSEQEYHTIVSEFWSTLEGMIEIQYDRFKEITLNLLVIAMDDQAKQEALKTEFERIINDSLIRLRNWLGTGVNRILEGKID